MRYGWLPDRPDYRDTYRLINPSLVLPTKVNLLDSIPLPYYDQGELGSCTGNGISEAYLYDLMKQGLPPFVPSRLFIYYNERAMEGTVSYDSGAMIRDGIKTINRIGVCSEDSWPYDINQFTVRPPNECYIEAGNHKSVKYDRVLQNHRYLKTVLASGFPIVFGFSVYDSFESLEVSRTGIVPMPSGPYDRALGGHCALCVGYDDDTHYYKIKNSWGPNWGDAGNFYLPYVYLTDPALADDFWTIEAVR